MPLREKVLHLRIDVDTTVGIEKGVSQLLDFLDRYDARATFFVPMGPDNLVRSGFRRLLKSGFVSHTVQMNPFRVYGVPYMVRGLFGFNRYVGLDHPKILRTIRDKGHEVALHGWNHAWWGDALMESTVDEIKEQLSLAIESYEKILGERPHGFGAPGWRCCSASLKALDSFGFQFLSETEGHTPSYLSLSGYTNRTLNLPMTVPPLFEVYYNTGYDEDETIRLTLNALKEEGFNLFLIHAEYEVFAIWDLLNRLFERIRDSGYRIVPVKNYFDDKTENESYDVYEVVYRTCRGTVGPSASQAAMPIHSPRDRNEVR